MATENQYSEYYNSLLRDKDSEITHQKEIIEILENDNHPVFQCCTNFKDKLFIRSKYQEDLKSCEKEIEKLNKEIAKQKDNEDKEFKKLEAKAGKEALREQKKAESNQLKEQKRAEREKHKSEIESQKKSKKLKQESLEQLEMDAESGKLFEPKDYLNLEVPTENFELSKFIRHISHAKNRLGESDFLQLVDECCNMFYKHYYRLKNSGCYMYYNVYTNQWDLVSSLDMQTNHKKMMDAGKYVYKHIMKSEPNYIPQWIHGDDTRIKKINDTEAFINISTRYLLKLWDNKPLNMSESDFEERWAFFTNEYLSKCLCGGKKETVEYVLQWVANVLHGKKCPTFLVLFGAEGTGKSSFKEFVCKLMPSELSIPAAQTDDLFSSFNEHLQGKFYVNYEEASTSNPREYSKLEDKIKTYTTDPTFTVNGKHKSVVPVCENTQNMTFATNNENALKHQGQQRRCTVLDICAEYSRKKYKSTLWQPLYGNCINNEDFILRARDKLRKMYNPDYDLKNVPITETKKYNSLNERKNTNPFAYMIAKEFLGKTFNFTSLCELLDLLEERDRTHMCMNANEYYKLESDERKAKLYWETHSSEQDRQNISGPLLWKVFEMYQLQHYGDRHKIHKSAHSLYEEVGRFGFERYRKNGIDAFKFKPWDGENGVKETLELLRIYVDLPETSMEDVIQPDEHERDIRTYIQPTRFGFKL
jgi:hypothetical protein